MSEETKSRKPSTPQLERVIDAIERGDYDEKIIELHRSLAARQDVLKAQVLEQVRQVFGDDAEIVSSKTFILPSMGRIDQGKDIAASASTPVEPEDENLFVKKADRKEEAIRQAPPSPVIAATADQIDENRITNDPLENVKSDAGLPISEVERRMLSGEQVVEIERRGAIISGLSASDIGD